MGIVWSKQRTYLSAGIALGILLLVSMFFALQKPVVLEVDGQVITRHVFFASSVGEVLNKENVILGEKDRVEPTLEAPVSRNMKISVIRCFPIKVTADGQTKEVLTTPVSVKEAIAAAGFTLGEKDLVKTLPSETLIPNQEIEIVRVSEKSIEEEQPVPYREDQTFDATLERGLTKTLRSGQNGVSLNTVKITYHNNMEVKREVIASKAIEEPVNKLVAMGTITSVSRGGLRLDFKEARYMSATAYTYTGNNNASGEQPEVGTVAVDPNVIPMGTRLYIEGYGYAVAADTGGAIKGDRIDLFMEDHGQCVDWGRRTVKVYVLN